MEKPWVLNGVVKPLNRIMLKLLHLWNSSPECQYYFYCFIYLWIWWVGTQNPRLLLMGPQENISWSPCSRIQGWIELFLLCLQILHHVWLFANPLDCSLSGSSVHGDSTCKNTGVGRHALLLGIFPTQRSSPRFLRLLHWQVNSLPLLPPREPLGSSC